MEITRGKRFSDLIRDEYEGHPADQRLIYGTLSVVGFNLESKHLHETELLQILGDPPYHELMAGIRQLVDERLVTAGEEGTLRVYHKAVADQVVRHLRNAARPELGGIIERMLTYYAERAWDIRDRSKRERAMMIRLLNHQYLIDLRLPPTVVRPIYDAVEGWLKDDFHYWLQRGAYEAERGDPDWADGYLRQARACEGGEHHDVLTHLGKLRLEAARRAAGSDGSIDLANEAIELLVGVADKQRGESPHTYAVLVDGVSRWLAAGPPLTEPEREAAISLIRDRLAEGRKECSDNPTFLRKADEAERRLAALGRPGGPRPPRFPTF
jgi:hypothetical protein